MAFDLSRSGRLSTTVSALPSCLGIELGPSRWHRVDQDSVDTFAKLTGDFSFIHVDPDRARETRFGGTIVHGYFVLSLLSPIIIELMEVSDSSLGVNYGVDKVRFPGPLPVGASFRGSGTINAVKPVPGGFEVMVAYRMQVKDQERPALVAECRFRYYA